MSKYKIILILIFYLFICFNIYKTNQETIEKTNQNIIQSTTIEQKNKTQKEELPIGKLIINKINLNQPLYSIDSIKNNIEENVTILKGSTAPTQTNSIIFLAAHSGPGDIAYFNDLDKLVKNDEIILTYNNTNYIYYVNDIWETSKDGNIEVIKEDKDQLILTTCSKTSSTKQLIINCTKKDA